MVADLVLILFQLSAFDLLLDRLNHSVLIIHVVDLMEELGALHDSLDFSLKCLDRILLDDVHSLVVGLARLGDQVVDGLHPAALGGQVFRHGGNPLASAHGLGDAFELGVSDGVIQRASILVRFSAVVPVLDDLIRLLDREEVHILVTLADD